jgi:serine/threonine-protein kinase
VERGGTLGDRYELTEKVGGGSVGEVWRATDRALGRVVAVKVLRREFVQDPTVLARFAAEAQIMARLSHPGIAGVYDYGRDADDRAYLVMTFVEGQPLRRLLAGHRPLPPERVMALVAQAASALRAAHRAGEPDGARGR